MLTKPLLLIVATEVLEEFHVEAFVTSHIPPPAIVPMAVNCTVVPTVTLWLEGLNVIDWMFAQVTVAVVDPLMVPFFSAVAVTDVLPTPTPVSSPEELIVAMLESPVVHNVFVVPVLPSSKVAVAVICCVLPWITDGVAGLTVRLLIWGLTKNPLQPTAAASNTRVRNGKKIFSLRLMLGINKAPAGHISQMMNWR